MFLLYAILILVFMFVLWEFFARFIAPKLYDMREVTREELEIKNLRFANDVEQADKQAKQRIKEDLSLIRFIKNLKQKEMK